MHRYSVIVTAIFKKQAHLESRKKKEKKEMFFRALRS